MPRIIAFAILILLAFLAMGMSGLTCLYAMSMTHSLNQTVSFYGWELLGLSLTGCGASACLMALAERQLT